MKFIGIPKTVKKRNDTVRSALGVGLLFALVLICVLGAESAFTSRSTHNAEVMVTHADAPAYDTIAPMNLDSTTPSLEAR